MRTWIGRHRPITMMPIIRLWLSMIDQTSYCTQVTLLDHSIQEFLRGEERQFIIKMECLTVIQSIAGLSLYILLYIYIHTLRKSMAITQGHVRLIDWVMHSRCLYLQIKTLRNTCIPNLLLF